MNRSLAAPNCGARLLFVFLAVIYTCFTLGIAHPVLAQSASMTMDCDVITCASGYHCVQIPGGVACILDTVDPCYNNTSCPPDYQCRNFASGLFCAYDYLCDFISCAEGTYCVNNAIKIGCIPNGTDLCEAYGCPEGFHCLGSSELGPYVCLPNGITCDDISCAEGFHCDDSPQGPGCVPNDPSSVEPLTWGMIKSVYR